MAIKGSSPRVQTEDKRILRPFQNVQFTGCLWLLLKLLLPDKELEPSLAQYRNRIFSPASDRQVQVNFLNILSK